MQDCHSAVAATLLVCRLCHHCHCQAVVYFSKSRWARPMPILFTSCGDPAVYSFLLFMLLQYTSCNCEGMQKYAAAVKMAYSKENSKLPCLPRNSQPFMTPLIIRMTLHPLQCKCQVSTIAFQLCCTSGLSANKNLKIFKTLYTPRLQDTWFWVPEKRCIMKPKTSLHGTVWPIKRTKMHRHISCSKALRYVTLTSVDFADTVFCILSKHVWDMLIVSGFYEYFWDMQNLQEF